MHSTPSPLILHWEKVSGKHNKEKAETWIKSSRRARNKKNRCLLKILGIKEINLGHYISPSFHSTSPGTMCQALCSGLGTQKCPDSWEGACSARDPCHRNRGNSCHCMEGQRGSWLENKEPLLRNQHLRGTAVPSLILQSKNPVVALPGSKWIPLLSTCQTLSKSPDLCLSVLTYKVLVLMLPCFMVKRPLP